MTYCKIRERRWGSGNKRAWICEYKDQNGKQRLKTFGSGDEGKKEAQKFQAKTLLDLNAGTPISDSRITISEAGERWIEAVEVGHRGRPPAEPATLRNYRYLLDTHIKPHLGGVKLSKLNRDMVENFRVKLLTTEGRSRSLVKKALTALKGILSEAQDRQLIAFNPAERVQVGIERSDPEDRLPMPSKAQIKAIRIKLTELASQDQAAEATPQRRIEAKAWRKRRAFIETALATGMRSSELRGLAWDAVDLSAGTIKVRQKADETGIISRRLKSKAARRTIPIPDSLVRLLREWKLECLPSPHNLVFPSERGRPQNASNIYKKMWKPIQIAAGVSPLYNFHSLRHFRASMLIASNANPKDVQYEMGHSDIMVTYNLYGHLFHDEDAEQKRRARAERLDESLS